jgi:transcriptional regulator with XRE-family HTH domain
VGRKAGLSHSEERLREEIARVLPLVIGSERGAQTSAARKLGITRQALSLYMLKKATPGAEILRRICVTWNLVLDIDGALITKQDEPVHREVATQLSILEALSDVEDRNIEIKILDKSSNTIDLKVSIAFDGKHRK